MQQMHFDCRDIVRAPRLALSLQRIWIQFLGVLLGLGGYLVLTYLSFVVSGTNLSAAWKNYGLLPCLFAESGNWIGYLVFAVAVLWLVVVYLVVATAVSRATYMLIKGNNFYTWREAFSFAIKKAGSVIMTPVALAVIIGLFVLGTAIVGWLGKIPFVGEFGVTIFTPIWFIATLITVFLALVAIVALIQVPAIIATTDDDAFEAVFQSFSLVWSQPWRLVFYQVMSGILAVAAFFVLAFLSKKAFIVLDRIFAATMGTDFMNISANGMYLVSVWVTHSIGWMESVFCEYSSMIYFSREFDPLNLPGYQIIASYIFAVWILLIGVFISSYGLASLNVGNTISYLILRKKKDNDNLLERKDREEEEEQDEADADNAEKTDEEENKKEE